MVRRILYGCWRLVEVIIVIYVVFITSCILCRNKYGYTQFGKTTFVSVDENSARLLTNVQDGDLLVVKSNSQIEVGDLIYYYATVNEEYVVRSGVVTSKAGDESSANLSYILANDSSTTVVRAKVLGKNAKQHSGWGKVLSFLESQFGFLFLVLLPIIIVFIYQVYEFVTNLRAERAKKLENKVVTEEVAEEVLTSDSEEEKEKVLTSDMKEEKKEDVVSDSKEMKEEVLTSDMEEEKKEDVVSDSEGMKEEVLTSDMEEEKKEATVSDFDEVKEKTIPSDTEEVKEETNDSSEDIEVL